MPHKLLCVVHGKNEICPFKWKFLFPIKPQKKTLFRNLRLFAQPNQMLTLLCETLNYGQIPTSTGQFEIHSIHC